MDPSGKVALISGGAKGIGFECSRILLQNGAKVVMCGTDSATGEKVAKEFNEEFGANKAIFVKCDVTNAEDFENVFKKTIETFGALHILFNNAGIFNFNTWQTEIAINFTAVTQGILYAFQYMDKKEGGVVINNASILGLQPFPGDPVYCATKHAVLGLTKSFGHPFHFDQTGVRVVAVCPGVTDTPLITEANNRRQLDSDTDKKSGDDLAALPAQTSEVVARAMLHLIRSAPNGSIWVSEGGEDAYQVNIPDRHTLKA